MTDSPEAKSPTISAAMEAYLRLIERARSKPTMLAYKNALRAFSEMLEKNSLKPDATPIEALTEKPFAKFVD